MSVSQTSGACRKCQGCRQQLEGRCCAALCGGRWAARGRWPSSSCSWAASTMNQTPPSSSWRPCSPPGAGSISSPHLRTFWVIMSITSGIPAVHSNCIAVDKNCQMGCGSSSHRGTLSIPSYTLQPRLCPERKHGNVLRLASQIKMSDDCSC